tara:strand:+ start:188 stop:1111 length:924 start_codon:yes stop_codon:yes gene_type:complete
MKKKLRFYLGLFLTILVVNSNAQEILTNKNNKVMLPEEGDWSISVDATSFIKFAADLAHVGGEMGATAPTFDGLNNEAKTYSISGRQFLTSSKAKRFSLRVFMDNIRESVFVNPNGFQGDPWPNNISDNQVKDIKAVSDFMFALGNGIEYRKGTKRLQGYYGYEGMIAIQAGRTKYNYGNDVDSSGFISNDFGGNINGVRRTTKNTNGMNISLGARGFIGAEYFVVPKISVGGEFGWGLGFYRDLGGKSVEEGLDSEGKIISDVERKTGSSGGFFIGNSRNNSSENYDDIWMNSFSPSGNLSLNLYF